MRGRVLIVDDDLETCRMVETDLGRKGFKATSRTSASEAMQFLSAEEVDAVATDLRMPGMSGVELCERIRANRPDVSVVVMTAFGSLETAVAAIRAGAYDFITKPFDIEELALTLDRAVEHRQLSEEVKRLRRAVLETQRYDDIVGTSSGMRTVFDLMDRLASSDASILITGETGTGKELVARTLHHRGRRKDGPFIAINCAAIPEALLESQLFGHVRGAFTDAHETRAGLFIQASGGTLFLDEIGDMPLGLQSKILRAIQERAVRPLGGNVETPFDARILAATNRDMEEAVEQGRFRRDLYFRINVIQINMPPLRARGSDVLLLAQHFVDQFSTREAKEVSKISPAAAERLLSYGWPGNVRELQNAIERAVALTRFEEITVEDLPDKIRTYSSSHIIVAGENPTELVPMEEVERRYILRVLQAVGGNKAQAAQILGMDRRTLYRKLDRYTATGNII